MAIQPGGSGAMLVGDGELILFSTDKGATWRNAHDPLDGWVGGLFHVAMDPSGRYAWITGANGVLLRTENYGQKWQQSESEAAVITICSGGRSGWACAEYGGLLHTQDHGGSWRRVNLGTNQNQPSLYEVIFDSSGKCGWVAGRYGGQFFFTRDSGETWTEGCAQTYLESREEFPGIAWQPGWERLWFAGFDLGHDSNLVTRACHSVYPYTEFVQAPIPVAAPLFKVWFSHDGRVGFALANSGLARSTDGGETWEACALSDEFEMAHGFWFDSEGRNGFVFGRLKMPNLNNGLLRTADGGETWFPMRVDRRNITEYFDLAFSQDCSRGWLVGAAGFIYSASLPDLPPVIHRFVVSRESGALDLHVEAPGVEAKDVVVDIAVSGTGLDFVQEKVRRRFPLSDLAKAPKWSPTMFLPGQPYRFQLRVSNGWNIASREFLLQK
jgi:photosystem II stability/assembly factor-like uncharacterized protein